MEKLLTEKEEKEIQGGAGTGIASAVNEEELKKALEDADIRLSASDLADRVKDTALTAERRNRSESVSASCSTCKNNPRMRIKVLA